MDHTARTIMVTELAKYRLFTRWVIDPSSEAVYLSLCEIQDDWLNNKDESPLREEMLRALRAAIHEQLHQLETA